MKLTTAIWASAGTIFALAGQPETAHADLTENTETPAAAAAEPVAGWFRIDTDGLGTQFWVGANHKVGPVTLATDLYVIGTEAEFDIGLAFSFSDLSLVLMVGPVFDFASMEIVSLVAPQLFTIYNGPIYFESWIQGFLPSIHDSDAQNTLYTRNFALVQACDNLAIGPQVEATINLGGDGDALASLPAGLRLNVGYGKNNTLGVFLGYEIQEAARKDSAGISGRFTFLRTW